MYDWNLRVSKRVDIWILCFCWAFTIFFTIANYVIYSTASTYDLYEAGTVASVEATKAFLYFGSITLGATILMLGDRKIASKKAREQSLPSEFTPPKLNFRKRNISRLVLLAVITFFSLPWILAIVGIYVSNVPGLNLIFLGAQSIDGHPAVHLGRHHGADAYFFAVFAIIMSVSLDSPYYLKTKISRSIIAGAIAFMSMYAIIAGFEDGLNEQLLKRGIDVIIYPFFAEAYSSTISWVIIAMISFLVIILWFFIAAHKERIST